MNAGAEAIVVVLNAGAGADRTEGKRRELEEAFATRGIPVAIKLVRGGDQLRAVVEDTVATRARMIVAAGGDGTVSTVAATLAGTSIPLGIVPLGTLNHFARDLGIPLDVDGAVGVIAARHTSVVDIGEVNGRTFINNASLGLYPRFVRLRQQHPVRGPLKWVVAAWAALKGLVQHRAVTLHVDVDGAAATRSTPVLLVGNNPYREAGFDGSRPSLRTGQLAIYIVRTFGRLQLLRLAWKMFVGRTTNLPELEVLPCAGATIELARSPVLVAIDGEIERMDARLEFRIRPGALTVFTPAAQNR